jgi:hypothetical protein
VIAVITRISLMKKIALITLGLILTGPVFAQSGDPAAGSASSPQISNPSGSGTSTSGGRDYNNDQGRDKMGTTGRAGSQYNTEGSSSQPAQPNVTGQQKSGTNAEGRAKP